ETEVDELLRRHTLVDLHRVVRQSLRASVEAYTLKQLEGLHHFERSVPLRDAARAMQLHGWWLETGEGFHGEPDIRETIERYNEDDCRSTWRLRDWLESRRPELELQLGRRLLRPAPEGDKDKAAKSESNAETARIIAQLTEHLPEEPARDNDEQRALRLLANLLDWHWREAKSSWWEYFRTVELPRDERLEDRAVLSDLRFVSDRGSAKRSRVHRYEFPPQEHRIRIGDSALDPDTGKTAGEVVEVGETYVDLKRSGKAPHPAALILGGPPSTEHQRARLLELGDSVIAHGLEDCQKFAAARRLLLRQAPDCGQIPGTALLAEQADTLSGLGELALRLDGAVLAVQGPPGSGKTYHAAHVIVNLVKAGKRVGVTANSHKVITSLIVRAAEVARASGVALRAVHNPGSGDDEELDSEFYELEKRHEVNHARLRAGAIDVLGGTAWAWSRPEFRDSVDVLVIDEAGQISLANALAVSLAAKNLMLFGDPAQLDQPQKGVHPAFADSSALEYLLGDALTLPDHVGVFLAKTWRLHPAICRFTSEVFYEGRLDPVNGLERQAIVGPGIFNGNGLRFVPVQHRGNSNKSEEEVDAIVDRLTELFRAQPRFVDQRGSERVLTRGDVLVVAPYNAQVAALKRRLPDVAVGTVDKFQGQQAPIVIYSMTSSSAGDAPRGMEFLYSLNRLNVATSRAQALVVLVASPELTRVHCKTPRQMRLVNALCAYLEHARNLT
ncbi:MAG TPA: AAA domain-containing protein, partial [Polyangiaceae bacterium]